MKNLEKLLDAFAMGLFVRHASIRPEEGDNTFYTEADELAKGVFKMKIRADIERSASSEDLGVVDYNYYVGRVRSKERNDSLAVSLNLNLAKVMDGLPDLFEGKSYVLPSPTFLKIGVTRNDEGEVEAKILSCCEWISSILNNQ